MKIVVDDRGRNPDLLAALSNTAGIQITRKRLAVGDLIVDDRLVFDRKTIHDFARSLTDGRLFLQTKRLSGSHLRPAWII
jgi:DNA excision repair protein ERCC-4